MYKICISNKHVFKICRNYFVKIRRNYFVKIYRNFFVKICRNYFEEKKIPSEFVTKSHKSLTGSLALSFHRKKSSSKFYYIQNKTVVMENDDRGIRSFPKVQLYKKFWLWTRDHLHWIRTVCDLCAFWTDILDPKK